MALRLGKRRAFRICYKPCAATGPSFARPHRRTARSPHPRGFRVNARCLRSHRSFLRKPQFQRRQVWRVDSLQMTSPASAVRGESAPVLDWPDGPLREPLADARQLAGPGHIQCLCPVSPRIWSRRSARSSPRTMIGGLLSGSRAYQRPQIPCQTSQRGNAPRISSSVGSAALMKARACGTARARAPGPLKRSRIAKRRPVPPRYAAPIMRLCTRCLSLATLWVARARISEARQAASLSCSA